MDPLIASSLIAGATSLIGQGATNAVNRGLSGYSYKKDLEQWHRQNEYNSPKQQMARLKAAGLNPNLVYGTGSVGNTTGQGPSYQKPDFKLDTKVDALPMMGQYQNIKQSQAQTDNIEADTLNKQTENYNKILQQQVLIKQAEKLGIDIEQLKALNPVLLDKLNQEVESTGLDIKQKKTIQPYQAQITENEAKASEFQSELIKQQIEEKRGNISLQKVQGRKMEEEIKNISQQRLQMIQDTIWKAKENELRSLGIDSKDNPLFKVISRILINQEGQEPGAIIKWLDANKPSEWIKKLSE